MAGEDAPPPRIVATVGLHGSDSTWVFNVHIGDTRSGQFHALPRPLRDELTRVFGPFLDRFGYLEQGSNGGR